MFSRRKFLQAAAISAVAPTVLLGGENPEKHSRWQIILNNDPISPVQFKPEPATWSDDTITAAWLGHATVFINFFGTKILTDPVMGERIGLNILGMFKLGPKRLVAPALLPEELPKPDLILLSHAHMDHLDIQTLDKFDKDIPVVMAKNTADVIDSLGFTSVQEVDWKEKATVAGIEIEGFSTKHFGWRFPWEGDRSRGNWLGRSFNAYLLSKNGKHIFFGGDTAYHDKLKHIGERNIAVELAIMPIGAYDPWIKVHANPEESLEMAQHINAKHILPIHWSTFILSDEPTNEPIERLKKAITPATPQLALDAIGKTWKMEG